MVDAVKKSMMKYTSMIDNAESTITLMSTFISLKSEDKKEKIQDY